MFEEENGDMARLKILVSGNTKHAGTRARGKLFESLVSQVLHHYGYRVDRLFHANYHEMEIEVEGKHAATDAPFYADCTFCETSVSAPDLQAFYGKYMARWHQEKRCHGLFIALPGLDGSAGEFYRDYIAKNSDVTVAIYEEDAVLNAVSASPGVAGPEGLAKHIPRNMGTSGDPFLFYTEKGVFWAWIITSKDKESPNRLALFDKAGSLVSDPSALGYLTKLYQKLADFDLILPFHDDPILVAGVRDVVKAVKILYSADGSLDIPQFRARAGLSGQLFYRTAKDMDFLGLVRFSKGTASLQTKLPGADHDIEASLRKYLQDRFRGYRLVHGLLKILEEKNTLAMDEVSNLFGISVPYRSVAGKAGLKYARILAGWMDFADLAIWDKKNRMLVFFDPATEIRERRLLLPKRRGSKTPQIQYSPVEKVAERLFQALHGDGRVDWTGFGKNTIFRALAMLEDLGFIVRRAPLIKMLPKGQEFVQNIDKRAALFAEGALQMPSFSTFMEILESHRFNGNTLLGLGIELKEKLGMNWKESTAQNIAKIMLDWARHAKLAPGVFAGIRKGPIKGWKKKDDRQMALF